MNSTGIRSLLVIFGFALISFEGNCQKAKTHVLTTDEAKLVKKDAATMFTTGDYAGALLSYKDLVKSAPDNVDYNYKLGYCYLETSSDKKAALPYLEKACKSPAAKKEWSYQLGLAYMYNEKFDEAIKAFTDFRDSKQKLSKEMTSPDRLIEMCGNGKSLIASPVNVTFTNLGKTINTPFEEYNPFVSADGKQLIFTSRRKGNVGGFIADLGIYTADIYSSIWRDTIWTKAKGAGGMVNTEWDEETVGYSATGDLVFIYFDNAEFYGDVGASMLKGKMWQRPAMMPTNLNSKSFEGGVTLSLDGTTMIFSSDVKGGLGESDLYMMKKGTNGEWSTATSLGNTINTKYAEDSPNLSLDGKSLYFASQGWNSMGGFDIFRSEWNESSSSWSEPKNIGYPLNDVDDNNFISFTGDGKTAYISTVRPGGFGDKDIYKVEFADDTNHPFTAFISGVVSSSTGGKTEITKVTVENKETGKITLFAPTSAFTDFVLPVVPGKYTLHVEGYNFEAYNEELTIEAENPPKEIVHNVTVKTTK